MESKRVNRGGVKERLWFRFKVTRNGCARRWDGGGEKEREGKERDENETRIENGEKKKDRDNIYIYTYIYTYIYLYICKIFCEQGFFIYFIVISA